MKKGMKKLATTLLAALLMITQLPAVESKAATSIGSGSRESLQTIMMSVTVYTFRHMEITKAGYTMERWQALLAKQRDWKKSRFRSFRRI